MVIGSAGFMGNTAGREWVLVLDFGSQYTQLIARRIREIGVYCEVHPYTAGVALSEGLRGVVLSGSPRSVHDADAPRVDFSAFLGRVPVLGICYGAQLLAHAFGGWSAVPSGSTEGQNSVELRKAQGWDLQSVRGVWCGCRTAIR